MDIQLRLEVDGVKARKVMRRKKISDEHVASLQFNSDFRCCLCAHVGDFPPRAKSGQIHHIDEDPSNNAIENLVWLCLDHHEEVGRTSRSARRIHPRAVVRLRDDLERRVRRQRQGVRRPREPGRPLFLAALDAGIVLDVSRRQVDVSGAWEDVAAEVLMLGAYPEQMGYEARRAILARLETFASATRLGMPAIVAASITRVTLDLLPLSLLYTERRRRTSRLDVDLLIRATTIGEALAYDGSLKLGDLRIADRGCDILWRVMSFAVIHKLRRLREAAGGAFRTAFDGATRSGLPGAVELVKLTQAHAEAGRSRLPEYPASLAALL